MRPLLAQCLRSDGVLYLDVNGAAHFSASLRPVLARLGFDTAVMPPNQRWRCLIRMWEGADGKAQDGQLARLPNWYLGGDFFGPLFHNFPLSQWVNIFRKAGLFLRAGFGAHQALRPMLASEAARLFMGCWRAEVCELLDLMHPAGFDQLLLTRRPAACRPWEERAKLLDWRPAQTGLYRISCPKETRRTVSRTVVLLRSLALRTKFEWAMPLWEPDLLRRCDGVKPVRQLLREAGRSAAAAKPGRPLFLLYQFAALNFFPP